MSVSVSVRSYTHSVIYVTDNILRSLKDIVRLSGLDPAKLVGEWRTIERGVRTWIESGHLERIVLEVYDPNTNALVNRWDVEISYEWAGGDGQFWTDTEAIRFAIRKAGVAPETARYDLKATLKPGSADVVGWSATTLRGTTGMIQQRIGTTVEGNGLSGSFSYYRRA
jgi:hypothetical protein